MGEFLSMLLGTLGASLLGNLVAGKDIVRAGSGNKKWKGIVRAVTGKNGIFNAASSFNKLWNTKVLSEPSKHSSWWKRLEDVLKTSFVFVFRRRLEDVLIKTNMFAIALRLQKTSSGRLGEDQYICLGHASSNRLQDVLKNVSKTSSRRLAKTFSRRFQYVSSS